ncbi:MAG: FtsQ-type POTRA domain-containing protein [bacterium]|nr:FtsQ-type POTRA domain-containing protein [bacterium]
MSERRPTGKRRRPSPARRVRPFWLLFLLALVLASIGGYALATWPALRPHDVLVEGNHVVPKGEILARAAVALDQNIWLQNTQAMRKRIAAIPYIDDVRVTRRLPATLVLSVTERAPFAVLRSGDGAVLADVHLRVLAPAEGTSARALPVFLVGATPTLDAGSFVTDPAIVALRDDELALLDAHIAPAMLAHDKYGDLVATLRSGVRILFGDETDLAKAIPLVNPILTQVGRAGRPISAIDLRSLSAPVVVYK